MSVTGRCSVCRFPVTLGDSEPTTGVICAQCVMIADGETYRDGSSPADGLSRGEILYIGVRVRSVRHAREARILTRENPLPAAS